jgi:hypothetical protein
VLRALLRSALDAACVERVGDFANQGIERASSLSVGDGRCVVSLQICLWILLTSAFAAEVFPEVRSLSRKAKSLPRSLDRVGSACPVRFALDPPGSLFAPESSSGGCDVCAGVSRELPDVWLSGPDVIAGILVTPDQSIGTIAREILLHDSASGKEN